MHIRSYLSTSYTKLLAATYIGLDSPVEVGMSSFRLQLMSLARSRGVHDLDRAVYGCQRRALKQLNRRKRI